MATRWYSSSEDSQAFSILNPMALLEICASSYQSAVNAEMGGADRIELCQNLEGGGTTPSFGLISIVKENLQIPVHVLIRPRTGDFVYSDDEYDIMLQDIEACGMLGCEGVVVGLLTKHNRVDVTRLHKLVQAAEPMAVTFHRAIDDCDDPGQALEDIILAGCTRVLTSGGAHSAVEGSLKIAELVQRSRGRIVIMPGAGIEAANMHGLIEVTNAREYHASAKMTLRPTLPSKFQSAQFQTDTDQVKALASILRQVT